MPSLHFSESGKGFPIVFIHGFCETHEIWREFTRPLANHFHVYALDLPGFGGTDLLPVPFSIDAVGDSVAQWLVQNKISKCLIVGHSLGGYVALSLAVRHAALIKAIGLFHSTSFADTTEKKGTRNRVIDFVRNNGVPPYIDTFVPGLFYNKENPANHEVRRIALLTKQETLIAYAEAMRDRPDRTDILRNNEIIKFFISGRNDTMIPPETTRQLSEISQNCRFFELMAVGHMGLFEAKTECQEIIRDFAAQLFRHN